MMKRNQTNQYALVQRSMSMEERTSLEYRHFSLQRDPTRRSSMLRLPVDCMRLSSSIKTKDLSRGHESCHFPVFLSLDLDN